VLIITDPGVRAAGIADEAAASLERAGYECRSFDRVEPNPKDRDCEIGGEAARQFEAEVIVAIGGGSVIDSAKAVALLQTHGGKLGMYQGRDKVTHGITPVVAVPTTAGTGSEVTRSAVITDTAKKFKMTIKDVKMAPCLAILDPDTTSGLPAATTASTGLDAFVHAIEAYTCNRANPFSDTFALAAMGEIFPSLRAAVANGNDKEARYRMMLGSLYAGIAFSHADVAAVHCLAEALGGLYDIPHGVANSMFLSVVTAYNAEANPAKHASAAAACGLPVAGLPDTEAAALLVAELAKMSHDIGIPRFCDYPGVCPDDFDFLAESSAQNGSTPSNCREIGIEDYLRLLRECYAKR